MTASDDVVVETDVAGQTPRAALVTGAGSGIGLAIATLLSNAGCQVIALDTRFAGVDDPPNVTRAEVDVTDATGVATLAAELADDSLDVVVNAAAVRPTGSVLHTPPDEWRRCFDVNVTGAYLVGREFLPKLRTNGCIVNVCSASGYGRKDLAAYSASKAALLTLTKCMALDHAPNAIRVNAVLPGTTATPMFEATMPSDGGPRTLESARTTTGLVLSAEEVAMGIYDVVTSNTLVTGAVIPIGLLPYEW